MAVRELARCFYSYKASNDDELSMEVGDIIVILSKTCEDEGWWRGELKGKSGVFPDNFVEIISADAKTRPHSLSSVHSSAHTKTAALRKTPGNLYI